MWIFNSGFVWRTFPHSSHLKDTLVSSLFPIWFPILQSWFCFLEEVLLIYFLLVAILSLIHRLFAWHLHGVFNYLSCSLSPMHRNYHSRISLAHVFHSSLHQKFLRSCPYSSRSHSFQITPQDSRLLHLIISI